MCLSQPENTKCFSQLSPQHLDLHERIHILAYHRRSIPPSSLRSFRHHLLPLRHRHRKYQATGNFPAAIPHNEPEILLQQHTPDVFTVSFCTIAPAHTVTVGMEYIMELKRSSTARKLDPL